MAHVTTEVHADAHGWLGPCWCLCSKMSMRAILGSMVFLQLGTKLMAMACATTKGHADVQCLCCHLKPDWSLWAGLSLEFTLLSMAHIATGDHAEVYDTYWCQRPCGCLWSLLLPNTMGESMIHAANGKGQRSFCSGINDSQLRMRDMEGFCHKPHLTPNKK